MLAENSVPLLRRLRTRASRDTALVASAHFQPLPRRHIEIAIEFWTGLFSMDEVAEAAANAALAAIEAAAGFAKIGNRRQLAVYRATGIPA